MSKDYCEILRRHHELRHIQVYVRTIRHIEDEFYTNALTEYFVSGIASVIAKIWRQF